MTFVLYLLLFCFTLGLVAVASNPSPYFAALGLVVVAGMGCGILIGHGGSFLSLILFLIYLGGMLVVFAYSAALAAEPFPEGLGSRPVVVHLVVYISGLLFMSLMLWGGWHEYSWLTEDEVQGLSLFRTDTTGVALLYSAGGWMLVISAWVLLLTLLVVLELTRGLQRGSLRSV